MNFPTVSVRVRDVLLHAQDRARRCGRTQQLELDDDLYIRIAPEGDQFLLFCLEAEPTHARAQLIAEVLGLQEPVYSWHQGKTLRSLVVTATRL